jgi:hypothetical protein
MMKDNETVVVLDNEGNRVLQEPEFDPLFQAAQLTSNRHFNNIVNLLPIPHQILTFEKVILRQSRYEEKLEDILTDFSWSMNLSMRISFQSMRNRSRYLLVSLRSVIVSGSPFQKLIFGAE